jgi:hypothetical protein
MKLRITQTLIFDEADEAEALKLFQNLKDKKEKLRTINKGRDNEEKSIIQLERCYHDESETKPCEIIERIESA